MSSAEHGPRPSRRELRAHRRAPDAVEQPSTSRAGRDLRAAILVGLGLLALVAASLFLRPEGFVVLVLLATSGALWEFARALGTCGIRLPLLPLWVGNIGILVSAYVAGASAMFIAFVLTCGGIFVWRVLDGGGPQAVKDAAAGVFAASYISVLAGFTLLLLTEDRGPLLVATFILCAVANDVGGYILGVLAGRHPMAPTISPKKSWEGFAGSVVLAGLIGWAMVDLLLGAPAWAGITVGTLAVCTATIGDLAESLLKRDLGLKDMGSLLPGHGGLMDRLDSLLMTAPVSYLLLVVFVS